MVRVVIIKGTGIGAAESGCGQGCIGNRGSALGRDFGKEESACRADCQERFLYFGRYGLLPVV